MSKLSSKSKWAWRAHLFSHNPENLENRITSKLKWVWKANFLCHIPGTLENWISFRDVQMLSLSFFEIPYVDKLAKNVQKQYVQVIPRSMSYVSIILLHFCAVTPIFAPFSYLSSKEAYVLSINVFSKCHFQ